MKKKISRLSKEHFAILCMCFFTFANIFFLFFRYMRGECAFQDFRARWQESAYFFHGINPFDALNGKLLIPEIGQIDPDMVTVPWAWLLGSIISPGFIPYEAAKIWGMIFYFVTCLVTMLVIFHYAKENFFSNIPNTPVIWCFVAALCVPSQYCWIWSFMCGNHGALACCFVIIALCIYQKHPISAGILMAFSMIKPQMAAPFFITFILIRQYKVVLTSAMIGSAVMIITCLVTNSGIFELLSGTSSVGTNLDGVFFGLFNILKYFEISSKTILYLDIIVGIIYLFITTIPFIKKNNNFCSLAPFIGATIASTFWFYKQSHDYVILILPCVALLQGINTKNTQCYIRRMTYILSIIAVFYIQSACRKIVCKLTGMNEQFSKELFMTFTCCFLIIVGLLIIREIKSSSAE